jgi:hypothetical protein
MVYAAGYREAAARFSDDPFVAFKWRIDNTGPLR